MKTFTSQFTLAFDSGFRTVEYGGAGNLGGPWNFPTRSEAEGFLAEQLTEHGDTFRGMRVEEIVEDGVPVEAFSFMPLEEADEDQLAEQPHAIVNDSEVILFAL